MYKLTPLIDLGTNYLPNSNRMYIKAEYMQVSGSAKGRCVQSMLEAYIKGGESLQGRTIIESTSGNTGLALCYYSCEYGYKTLLVVDSCCSETKIQALENAGAKVLLPECPAAMNPREFRCEYVKKLAEDRGCIWLNQYDNENAPLGHIHCAREIAEAIAVPADYCFIAVGTGATFRGISDGMKKYSPTTVCIGVEPRGSRGLSASACKEPIHGINFGPCFYRPAPYIFGTDTIDPMQGINFGPGFHRPAPYIFGTDTIDPMQDKIIACQVSDSDAIEETARLIRESELEVGISTGMCVRAARDFIRANSIYNQSFVFIAADGAALYGEYLHI